MGWGTAFAGAAMLLGGCASVSMVKRDWLVSPVPAPNMICVRPFTVEAGRAEVNRAGTELDAFEQKFSLETAGRFAGRLQKFVGPAKVIGAGERVTDPGHWVIEGRFVRMEQGSRALRSVIGFGLGGTRLETLVDIHRIDRAGRRQNIAVFETTGGSNAEPGALAGGPFGALPRLVAGVASTGLAADARRTARMVTAAIYEKLALQGVPLAGPPIRARDLSADARKRFAERRKAEREPVP